MRRTVSSIITMALLALVLSLTPAVTAAPVSGPSGGATGTWENVASGGFGAGSANATAGPLAVFNGKLYAGVANDAGVMVRVKDGANWTPTTMSPGFGYANNKAVARMQVFGGKLYAGTANQKEGCMVFRYDGAAWECVVGDEAPGTPQGPGFGLGSPNLAVSAMAAYDNKLYVGVTNFNTSSFSSVGCQIWSSADGTTWAEEPLDGGRGFGDTLNEGVTSLAVFDNFLFAGTARVQIGYEFIDFTHVKITLTSKGCELHKLAGAAWSEIGTNGFTDVKNAAANTMEVFGNKLYIGTTNGDATADVTGNFITGDVTISDYSYTTNGLCVYTTDGLTVSELVRGGFDSTDDFSAASFLATSVGGTPLLLASVGRVESAGRLKVFDGTDWFAGADDGFGNSNNGAIAAMAPFENVVYAGTGNDTEGCEVWKGVPPTSRGEAAKTWYLAEGSTAGGFETWVLIQNPNPTENTARVTYMTPSGAKTGPDVVLAPNSRQSINVANTVPEEASVSTQVTSDIPVICERAMYWNGRAGGHDSVGVTAASPTWYLAEGSTAEGFETWILVQNPGTVTADVQITYLTATGEQAGPALSLGPSSRQSVNVAQTVPDQYDVSTKVGSNAPVIAERAVYWNGRRGGHDSIGVTAPSSTWYLAEGSTAEGFETWVLVMNPGTESLSATLTYMTTTGEKPGQVISLAPGTRQSVRVADVVPDEANVSTKVTSTMPVIAERAMYWGGRIEGHDSIGASVAAKDWYLAEGSTAGGFETWILVQNPLDEEVTAQVTYMTPSGEKPGPALTLAPNSRQSVNVAASVPEEYSVSTKVSAGKPVISERAVYWNNRTAGHDSIGAVL